MRLSRLAVAAVLLFLPGRAAHGQGQGAAVPPDVYEGWRQYSVHCARCHGQDVLGNPVAANLLESTGKGGATAEEGPFTAIVLKGRPDRGMPGFQDQVTAEQASAIYAYVRGRATGEVPAGRPRDAGS